MAYHTEELPKTIRRQVEDFIEFLLQRYRQEDASPAEAVENPRLKLYGFYQGNWDMSADFDEPLDDFEAYM